MSYAKKKLPTPKKKVETDNELYESLKGFVEKIIDETDDKFSKEEISEIIMDLLPDVDAIIEKKLQERLGDINSQISKLIITHLGFLADHTSDHIKSLSDSLKKGG